MNDEIVYKLCKNIFKKDKTLSYGYGKKECDKDASGNLPGVGKRWLTPKEMVHDFVREHFPDRDQELFEK